MPDAIFADARLAVVYDAFEDDRADLLPYLKMAREFDARTVLDVGCGTGCFALLLAEHGYVATGVDPAAASLAVARAKVGAERVTWLDGDATSLPRLNVDLAVMTGNVAQVFLTSQEWAAALRGVAGVLRPGGRLVFETRRPQRRAWRDWAAEPHRESREIAGFGEVTREFRITDVSLPYVSFRYTYTFASDGLVVDSDSTLRFRSQAEVEQSLTSNGFVTLDVRDAPDRPGHEYVFVAEPTQ